MSSSVPIKGHNFCQTLLFNSGVTRFESWTISHTFSVILAATAPPAKMATETLEWSITKIASFHSCVLNRSDNTL